MNKIDSRSETARTSSKFHNFPKMIDRKKNERSSSLRVRFPFDSIHRMSFLFFFLSLSHFHRYEQRESGKRFLSAVSNRPRRNIVFVWNFQSEASALLEGDTRAGIAGRARNLRHDVQRKISRLRQDRTSSEAFPCSASSVESLPSGSGSSTQALVRAGSNHSSISCEDRDAISPTSIGPVLCRARALVDYTPSPYDKEALKFKVCLQIIIIRSRELFVVGFFL